MNRYFSLILALSAFGMSSAQEDSAYFKKFFNLRDFKDLPKIMAAPIENPFVLDWEEDCITYDFTQQFKLGTAAPYSAIPIASMEFTKASYDQAVRDAACTGNTTGIVVHFGLVNGPMGKTLDVALEFVCLIDKGNGKFDYIAPEVHYTISNGALVADSGGVASWKSNWTNFTSNVAFFENLGDTTPRGHDPKKDVEYVVFPETEIRQLISDNGMTGTDKFKLKPTAEPTATGNRAFRQGIVWIPMNVVLTNTIDPNKPFYQKGADLGSPCPSLCPPNIIFRTTGERVRNNCPH